MLYRGLAKVAEKYIHKGDKLYIEGRIRYRSYDDQKGMRRYVTEILAENMEMLTPKQTAVSSPAGQPADAPVKQDSTTTDLPF